MEFLKDIEGNDTIFPNIDYDELFTREESLSEDDVRNDFIDEMMRDYAVDMLAGMCEYHGVEYEIN